MDERKSSRRWGLVAASVLAAVAMFWLLASDRLDTAALTNALGFKPAAKNKSASATKPICSQVIAPVGDCIPQHLAHLPPDPGPEGKKTLEGIDADKDGVRDDVQRFIFIEYGHSARAVKALTSVATAMQTQVKLGASITSDAAYALVKDDHVATCYSRTVDQKDREGGAIERLRNEVANTPERSARFWDFQHLLANRGFMLPDFEEPLEKLCGYDPAKLPN